MPLILFALYGILFIYGPTEPRYLANFPFFYAFGGPLAALLVILALRRLKKTSNRSYYQVLILVLCLFQLYLVVFVY